MNNLPVLQTTVLNDDQLSKHRAFIAIKAQALMGRYFQVPQDELVKRDILLGWMDMLQDYTELEITNACSEYLIVYPSKRPHEGLILDLIIKARKRFVLLQPKKQIPIITRKEPDAAKRKEISNKIMKKFDQ